MWGEAGGAGGCVMERSWHPFRKEGLAWWDPRLFSCFNPSWRHCVPCSTRGCFLSISQWGACLVVPSGEAARLPLLFIFFLDSWIHVFQIHYLVVHSVLYFGVLLLILTINLFSWAKWLTHSVDGRKHMLASLGRSAPAYRNCVGCIAPSVSL